MKLFDRMILLIIMVIWTVLAYKSHDLNKMNFRRSTGQIQAMAVIQSDLNDMKNRQRDWEFRMQSVLMVTRFNIDNQDSIIVHADRYQANRTAKQRKKQRGE